MYIMSSKSNLNNGLCAPERVGLQAIYKKLHSLLLPSPACVRSTGSRCNRYCLIVRSGYAYAQLFFESSLKFHTCIVACLLLAAIPTYCTSIELL